jgi:hypothetical protein
MELLFEIINDGTIIILIDFEGEFVPAAEVGAFPKVCGKGHLTSMHHQYPALWFKDKYNPGSILALLILDKSFFHLLWESVSGLSNKIF